jgi:hypothetical protein
MNTFMRDFVTEYNLNIRLHNEVMLEYNRNINRMMDELHRPSFRVPPPTPFQYSNRLDVEYLIHLLSQHNTLSQIQIDNATQMVAYNAETFSSSQCPISLDDFVENEMVCQIIHCGHIFKERNIMRWLETHRCCPVCRHDIRESAPNYNTDISGNTFELPLRFNGRN